MRCNLACDLVKLIDQLSVNLHVYSGAVRNIFEHAHILSPLPLSLSLFLPPVVQASAST